MKTDMKNEFLQLERKYWQAIQDRNFETALSMTDDPCIVTGAQGVGSISKDEFIKMMQSDSSSLDKFEISDDAQFRMLGNDVGVLAYTVHEEMTVDGKPVVIDAAEASTWVRRDGRWVCAMHTESLKGDPFGRDRLSA